MESVLPAIAFATLMIAQIAAVVAVRTHVLEDFCLPDSYALPPGTAPSIN
jgi:hypothetical protein